MKQETLLLKQKHYNKFSKHFNNGDVSVNGTVTVSEDVIGGGISLKNHTHDYNPGPGSPTPTQPPK